MSTRSNVVVRKGNRWRVIYVHHDGYPEGVGKTLYLHYNTQELANQLVGLGDLSAVGKFIGEKHPFGTSTIEEYREHLARYGEMCTAYHRDRGEDWTAVRPTEHDSEAAALRNCGQEFLYYWDGEKWRWTPGTDRGERFPYPKMKDLEPSDCEDTAEETGG